MSLVEKIALGAVIAFLAVAAVRLLAGPLKTAVRVLANTALGFGAVWLLNLTTSFTGLHLGLSLFNALTIGILGLPGFAFLLLLQWVLT